jgi:uncharacterized repeat protein (TIGR01451 family)
MNLSSRDELAGSTEEASMHSLDFLQKKRPTGSRWWRQALCRAEVIALCALTAPLSFAADATAPDGASEGVVRVKLTQARVVVEAGKEKLVEAEVLKPGDVIEYRAVYTNTSKETVRDLMATLPVPEGLEYVARSARASDGVPAVQAATRDGKYGAEPLMVTEGAKKVPVPLALYRALRWQVSAMAAGRSVTVSARARVPAPSPAGGSAPAVATPR